MDDDLVHRFGGPSLSVAVSADGAEPISLSADGVELLWQAGPAWPRHAPVLFPIVGRLAGDTLRHAGHNTRLTQHGFARDRRFTWLDRDTDGCRLRLEHDLRDLVVFPFRFTLDIDYRLDGPELRVTYLLHNPDRTVLPASIGAHPAFRWPLADGIPKQAHRLVFEQDEPAPIRRVSRGLLLPDGVPSPIRGRTLALDEALFADDAVILDQPASRWVRYEADGAPHRLTVGWHGMTQLGIWSKPPGTAGADFLCIEPWHGMASPVDFDNDFTAKPHLLHIAPGDTACLGWSVAVTQ